MSSRKRKARRQGRPNAENSDSRNTSVADSSPGNTNSAWAHSPSTPRVLKSIAAVAAVWWVILAGLAIFTANPVVINRKQIRQSEIVVTATVADARGGLVVVDKTWAGAIETETQITIDSLDQTAATDGGTYLIPLSRGIKGRFRITQAEFRKLGSNDPPALGPKFVYPANPESIAQLQQILEEFSR